MLLGQVAARHCTPLQGSLSLWGHKFRTFSLSHKSFSIHNGLGICEEKFRLSTVTHVAELLLSVKKHFLHLELAALDFTCSGLHLPPSWALSYPDCELGTDIHLLYHKVVQFKCSLAPLSSPVDHIDLDLLVLVASFSAAGTA